MVAPQPTRVGGSPRGVMTTSPARHPEPEPPERTERAGTVAARRAPESPAGRVLELQRSVGNRAVAALVARDPKPGAAPAKERHYEVKFPDIGTIEVLSWSWGESGRGRHGSGGTGRVTSNELNFSSEVGPHSAALMNATASGTPLGTVVLEAFNEGKV